MRSVEWKFGFLIAEHWSVGGGFCSHSAPTPKHTSSRGKTHRIKIPKYRSQPERFAKANRIHTKGKHSKNWSAYGFLNSLVQTLHQITCVCTCCASLDTPNSRADKRKNKNKNLTPRYLRGILQTLILAFATNRAFPRYRFYNLTVGGWGGGVPRPVASRRS